jgi:DNA-binding beta-propeller fold protein YncE
MTVMKGFAGLVMICLGLIVPSQLPAQETSYLFYVASESDDEVTLLRYSRDSGLRREKVITVGSLSTEIEAPHGVFVDPNGKHWYVTLGHGFPFGFLVRYATGADTVEARVELGLFPATVAIPPFGGLALAVNSDFHGDMTPGTVSVVDLASMTEIARTETCTMPHGSRFSPDGLLHYSACMMDDQLVEIDVATLSVSRRLDLIGGEPVSHHTTHANDGRSMGACSPTWVTPGPDGSHLYVTCNRGNQVLEVDAERFAITRRFESPGAPYNAAVTSDGSRLVVSLKAAGAVGVWDLSSGQRLAIIENTRSVTHGLAITPDDHFAFVTVEGVGGEPGTVEVIDLTALRRVDQIDVGKQAGGIAFWRVEN